MEVYLVYVRSMSTYDDYYLDNVPEIKEKIYRVKLQIFYPIGFFPTFSLAKEWLYRNGKKYSESFYELHNQGCAFVIRKGETITEHNEDVENKFDLHMVDRSVVNYVFTEESYNMVLIEHLMYLSHDWDNIFPSWIKYVKRDRSIIGAGVEHLEKAHRVYGINEREQNKQIERVTKYSHTGNLDDLGDLYHKRDEY
jgi:hypothetical protein